MRGPHHITAELVMITLVTAYSKVSTLRFSASTVILSRPSANGFNPWLLQIVHWWFWRTQGQRGHDRLRRLDKERIHHG
jgi:hypothetical protein